MFKIEGTFANLDEINGVLLLPESDPDVAYAVYTELTLANVVGAPSPESNVVDVNVVYGTNTAAGGLHQSPWANGTSVAAPRVMCPGPRGVSFKCSIQGDPPTSADIAIRIWWTKLS